MRFPYVESTISGLIDISRKVWVFSETEGVSGVPAHRRFAILLRIAKYPGSTPGFLFSEQI